MTSHCNDLSYGSSSLTESWRNKSSFEFEEYFNAGILHDSGLDKHCELNEGDQTVETGHGEHTTSIESNLSSESTTVLVRQRARTISNMVTSFMGSLQYFGSTFTGSIGSAGSMFLQQQRALAIASFPNVPSNDRRASTFMTTMNVLCLIQGVNIFAFPFVMAKAGLPVLIAILFLGICNWYSVHLIADCQYQLSTSEPGYSKRIYPTYLDIGAAAFPTYGKKLMAFINISTLLTTTTYLILLGQVTFDLLNKALHLNISPQVLACLWAALVFPSLFIRRVSVIAAFSCIAVLSLTASLMICFSALIARYKEWDLDNLKVTFNVGDVLLACGVIINSYFLHLIVPAIEGSMKKPEQFKNATAASFFFNTLLKVSFGLIATLTLGSKVHQSVTSNLTSSMPILLSITIFIMLNLFLSFPICICVLFEMLDTKMLPKFHLFHGNEIGSLAWLILSRLLVLLSIVLIAVSVPQFSLVVSFLGNVRGSAVALFLPVYFYLKLKWRHIGLMSRIFHIILAIFYIALGGGGAYYSLAAIIHELKNSS
eukprot:Seg1603.11 transcript_id=Seg1603.11/GoldUCD/mRNA.D3Y31 product="Vesicular inhibitory amino acid transporter" protein_id=Seg1603.11/GoldUCD/D3Y31